MLEFRVLGPLEVSCGGRWIGLRPECCALEPHRRRGRVSLRGHREGVAACLVGSGERRAGYAGGGLRAGFWLVRSWDLGLVGRAVTR